MERDDCQAGSRVREGKEGGGVNMFSNGSVPWSDGHVVWHGHGLEGAGQLLQHVGSECRLQKDGRGAGGHEGSADEDSVAEFCFCSAHWPVG
jgi:hypothetical protein